MNDEQFELAICELEENGSWHAKGLRARDTAQREALALLERELDRERDRADMAEVELQNARAALATQPAAGEPVAFSTEHGVLFWNGSPEDWKGKPVQLYLAPPAAAPVAAGEPVAEFFVEFATLRRAMSIYGLSAPESNHELGSQMERYAIRVIEAVAKLPFPYPPTAAHGDGKAKP